MMPGAEEVEMQIEPKTMTKMERLHWGMAWMPSKEDGI
jgi:hypothetical protein